MGRNNKKKEFYQGIINELVDQHGKDKFTYRLFGERLGFSKQRAKQLVDHFELDIPSLDYFETEEYADLRRLVEANEISQYTFQDLHQHRYKKYLPSAFIRSVVAASGQAFANTTIKALFGEFLSNTTTEDKTKAELFAQLQAMHPDKTLNFSSFCSEITDRKLPFKRKRMNRRCSKNEEQHKRMSALLTSFLVDTAIDPSLYAYPQLHVLYGGYAKNNNKSSMDYLVFRKIAVENKVPVAKTMPMALLSRLFSLGVDLKSHTLEELAGLHNLQYPLFPTIPKMLNNYALKPHLG